ncbi:hypothetical protein OAR38_03805 [Flavobacteriaceae bacterium]|nr:hypothetical protein [Flavobacteriaceae bacterium]
MGRKKGIPNKITAKVKDRLATIIDEAMDSIDVEKLTVAERIKLIQIGLQYVIPRLKQVEEITDEMPTNFQIEIIDSLSKYSDKDLDKAIKNKL